MANLATKGYKALLWICIQIEEKSFGKTKLKLIWENLENEFYRSRFSPLDNSLHEKFWDLGTVKEQVWKDGIIALV